MNIQRMKDYILDLARKGKLVEQDSNDEPATELFKKIQIEKAKLIKDGNVKIDKDIQTIQENEIPFEIPNSWKWVRLGEISKIVGGGTPETTNVKYWKDGTVPWITPADMNKCKYINCGRKNITAVGLQKSSATLMPKGTVLFSSRAPIGYVGIANNSICSNQGLKSSVPIIMEMNEYIYWYLLLEGKKINNKASGTTFNEVSGKIVKNIIVALPPLKEQKRIANKVEELFNILDNLYEEQTKYNKLLEVLRNKTLDLAIRGKLLKQDSNDEPVSELLKKIQIERDKLIKEGKIKKDKNLQPIQEIEIPFTIPSSWKWVRLGEVVNFKIGKTPERKNSKYWKEGIYNWISIADMNNCTSIINTKEKVSEVAYKEVFKENISCKGTLIMSFKLTVGKTAILDVDAFHNEAIISIYPIIDKDCFFRNYLCYIIPNLDILCDSKKAIKGQTLNTQSINNLLLPLPPLEEQKRIVDKIEKVYSILK